jgi:radical SAM superfamily enzyme YgiQ (UPF0313 family)
MTDILFTHSYFLKLDPKQWKLRQPYAPLGTLYAASLLRENGFSVALHDTMFCGKAADVVDVIKAQQPAYFVVYDDGFNYLTKMCLTNMRDAALEMIQFASILGCKIIVSSSDATDHPEKYFDSGADYVIKGEAEQTLLELVQELEKHNPDINSIKGICYMKDNRMEVNENRKVMKDLDLLPLPAWDLVDLKPYKKMWFKSAGYFSMNIATTRGCPFKCNWCAKPIYGNRYNVRSPKEVIAEIKMIISKYDADHIWFCDDIFGLKPGWVIAFAHLLKMENIRIRFRIQSRADLLLQQDYVQALKDAGCETVWIGAESGSQKILDAMDKGITVEQIEKATVLLKQFQIKPCFFIQFGYLDESPSDIESTIQMIQRLMPHEIGISVSYPLPGTPFYERVKTQLSKKSNWTDSDELALMFRNQQSSSYYKQLHRYVHKLFRTEMAWQQAKKLLKHPLQFNFNSLKKIIAGCYYLPSSYLAKTRLRQLENMK